MDEKQKKSMECFEPYHHYPGTAYHQGRCLFLM